MENHEYSDTAAIQMEASIWSFLISFGLGTLLLIIYLMTRSPLVITLGLVYVLFAVFFNAVILINNVILLTHRGPQRFGLLWRTVLLLLNIPIALWYADIVIRNI